MRKPANRSCASCSAPGAKLYDERREVYVCSSVCLADSIAANSDEFAEWYGKLYVTEDDE